MSETSLEKRRPTSIKEKGQYAIAFSVVGVMLWAIGFPAFLLFFFGALTFFVWKVFSTEGRTETRRIFEFYLSANEIIRDDDRRWYGFEIQETISRGETIVRSMSATPPLVHYALGVLYQKINDHMLAVKHLSFVFEENTSDELGFVYPTKELREYVRMLRKIERSPAEAPLTSSAIRSLERSRKNRGREILENSRLHVSKVVEPTQMSEKRLESVVDISQYRDHESADAHVQTEDPSVTTPEPQTVFVGQEKRKSVARQGIDRHQHVDRKTISEVLHDIYDKNAS